MKKTYKIEVDCANCANKIEICTNKIEGVKSAVVNFMTQKMIIEFEETADIKVVLKSVVNNCRKIESDFQIYN